MSFVTSSIQIFFCYCWIGYFSLSIVLGSLSKEWVQFPKTTLVNHIFFLWSPRTPATQSWCHDSFVRHSFPILAYWLWPRAYPRCGKITLRIFGLLLGGGIALIFPNHHGIQQAASTPILTHFSVGILRSTFLSIILLTQWKSSSSKVTSKSVTRQAFIFPRLNFLHL